eukprot:CAMPEP_0172488908 /NCGR_PEP_ID=MMETSP1066-20121228/18623_1 /TAXON_ID=671091 /ORGANISM="Coscinodiscus wailesii, Strain CCMP2513" /LENGTH=74 /DNA_ID=CAMNT_0013256409 /DNA_START=132 /DNA_END=353 /DNA_ORIENTATION=-
MAGRELTERDLISRFLEQATFGPTREAIDSWDMERSLDSAIPSWVYQQIMVENPTIHREYYRKRAQARIFETIS